MDTKRLHLLVVDDEEAHVEAIRRAYDMAGATADIHAVSTLHEFREYVVAHPPDLALVDLNLPDGRALEVLTHPPEDAPFPILVMTAFGNQRIVVEVMKAGALDYVVKSPEAFTMLPRTVEGALREWRLLQSHKQAEDALRQSEERFRGLLQNVSSVAVQSYGPDGITRFWNQASERLYGYTAQEAVGRSLHELIIPPEMRDEVKKAVQQMTQTGQPIPASELSLMRKDGTRITVFSSHAIVRVPGRAPELFCIDVDMTHEVQLEQQLRQTQKMEAIGRLAGGVAHDFNNILAVILMNASALRDDKKISPEQAEGINDIAVAAERGANLTRQLLAFSRRQVMQPGELDLNDVVVGITKMLQRLIGEDIALQTSLLPGTVLVWGDAGMIEQILLNLAVNARDAMPEGGRLAIEMNNHVVSDTAASGPKVKAGDYVRLTVRDTGCGIAPEHISHIFEPFYTTKVLGEGTGLGLATVHGIVEQHHGWIEVESAPGKGAAFHVYLPRLPVTQKSRPEGRVTAGVRGGCETILLVEDEPALRALAVRILELYGYRVLDAPNGKVAKELWRQHHGAVELLLTDIIMPEGLSGGKLAEELRSERPDLKVIYMSGYPGEMAGKGLDLAEGRNFLQKPFASTKLVQTVRECLDSTSLAQP